jgi:hypothetical protein
MSRGVLLVLRSLQAEVQPLREAGLQPVREAGLQPVRQARLQPLRSIGFSS